MRSRMKSTKYQQENDATAAGFGTWSLRLLLMLLLVLTPTAYVDQKASTDYEQLFQRALVTFALARTLNGVISVVQGTEVALQPAGVGVTLTPGQILDPVNDLIERFSWIMMGASISLGVQSVLLDISAWWPVKAILCLLALWWLLQSWLPGLKGGAKIHWLPKILVVFVVIRFAAPLMLIANDFLYQEFLEQRYEQSTEVVVQAGEALENLQKQAQEAQREAGEEGMIESISRAWSNTVDTIDLKGRVERMQARAADVIEHLLELSVVFILQTAILPVTFLWLFLLVFKRLFIGLGSQQRHS